MMSLPRIQTVKESKVHQVIKFIKSEFFTFCFIDFKDFEDFLTPLRFEPSSRTALIGEQPNPWELLHPQDAMGRHRGAKPLRRCGLLGGISLLSPG
jgi:hypothetical protein